jgi:hypothetical protein
LSNGIEPFQKRLDGVSSREVNSLFSIDLGASLNVLFKPTLVFGR